MTVRPCGTVTEEAVASAQRRGEGVDPLAMLESGVYESQAKWVEHSRVKRKSYPWKRFIHGTDKPLNPATLIVSTYAMTEAIHTNLNVIFCAGNLY